MDIHVRIRITKKITKENFSLVVVKKQTARMDTRRWIVKIKPWKLNPMFYEKYQYWFPQRLK